jgi:hypothetical protein
VTLLADSEHLRLLRTGMLNILADIHAAYCHALLSAQHIDIHFTTRCHRLCTCREQLAGKDAEDAERQLDTMQQDITARLRYGCHICMGCHTRLIGFGVP